jgi:hypothetical protein
MPLRQTMSLGDTLLQLLFRFIVNSVYGAYLPRSYVGSDRLLRQHFPQNVLLLLLLILLSFHGHHNHYNTIKPSTWSPSVHKSIYYTAYTDDFTTVPLGTADVEGVK